MEHRTVSLSIGIIEQVDVLIKELRFWPSRGAFVREACMEKIEKVRETWIDKKKG